MIVNFKWKNTISPDCYNKNGNIINHNEIAAAYLRFEISIVKHEGYVTIGCDAPGVISGMDTNYMAVDVCQWLVTLDKWKTDPTTALDVCQIRIQDGILDYVSTIWKHSQ